MRNVYLICNSHLDLQWLWRWEEGCTAALATFRTVVDLLEEYPELVFNHNESILYEWIREYEPELFTKIQKLVREKRWHIMGGWYLQPDCNMPCGESIIRNMLMGQTFFQQYFSQKPLTAVNFDSFGHSRGLVQILKQGGYHSYIVCRPDKTHFPFSDQDFTWEGLDGSTITVHRSDENYNSVLGKAAEELRTFLKEKDDEPILFLWGVGDHGGGPSRKDLNDFRLLQSTEKDAFTLKHTHPEDYFSTREKREKLYPVLRAGMNPVSEGCYTSQIRVKQEHRRLEAALYVTERMCVQAELTGAYEYPSKVLVQAQKDLLFSEFHDALPGSGIRNVEEDTLRYLHHGQVLLAEERMKAFYRLVSYEKPVSQDMSCILIYNPHPFEIHKIISAETELPKQNWDWTYMMPEAYVDGNRIPSQIEKEDSDFRIDWRKRICMDLILKPFAVTRVDVAFSPIPGPDRPLCPNMDQNFIFENKNISVKFDASTGMIEEYRVNGNLIFRHMKLVARPDIYNSWGLEENLSESGTAFVPVSTEESTAISSVYGSEAAPVRIIEDGEVRTVVESVLQYHDSKAVVRFGLPKDGSQISLELKLFWNEKDKYLKLETECFTGEKQHIGQIMLGREKLAYNHESVSQKWCGVIGKETMFAIANDGCHGSSLVGDQFGITLIRSAGYACSDCNGKMASHEKRFYDRMDQGMRDYSFILTGGEKESISRDIDRIALVHNEECPALSMNPSGKGAIPQKGLQTDAANIMLSCMKKAENGDGYIIRLYECQGLETETKLLLPITGTPVTVRFMPYQLKTYRFDPTHDSLCECELLEGF